MIRKTSQELTIDPQEVNNTFKEYCSKLYTSEFPQDTSYMLEFLENLNVPKITQDQSRDLERPFDNQEIENSIKGMQSGKAPRPDGASVEFYKNLPH